MKLSESLLEAKRSCVGIVNDVVASQMESVDSGEALQNKLDFVFNHI